jgi:hypothetical protein
MRRSAELAPLSRDHQHALEAALRLRRATPETVDSACAHFGAFFAREGREHFAIEEEHLLPALPEDDSEWAAAAARVRADHAAIRQRAAVLADGAANTVADRVSAARELGERMTAHVRFEERVLFDLLERRLAPADLARVGAAVARAEAERLRGSS